MKTLTLKFLPGLLLAFLGNVAGAAVIVNQPTTDADDTAFYGQSFTTPAGGPWTNIKFHWFDLYDSPIAAGKLYLRSTELPTGGGSNTYEPQDVSAAGGNIASAVAASNQYDFGAITLIPSTQYWVYMDDTASVNAAFAITDAHTGGTMYSALIAAVDYTNDLVRDVAFQVNGDLVSSIPEPSTLVLLGVASTVLFVRRRRYCAI